MRTDGKVAGEGVLPCEVDKADDELFAGRLRDRPPVPPETDDDEAFLPLVLPLALPISLEKSDKKFSNNKKNYLQKQKLLEEGFDFVHPK